MANLISWTARCARGLAAVALICLPAVGAQAQDRPCGASSSEIFARVSPSVVQVFSMAVNPFLVANRIAARSGTGFVIEGGYVVTNYHVVADAGEIVMFGGEQSFEAAVVGIDPTLDVALLAPFFGETIGPPLAFADPGALRIGQPSYAVGYPLGLGKSISSGIISGISRVLPKTTSSWLSPYIQTDAAISPGNSGGPLVDECAEVIGMITSGISEHGAENIGFAIPVEILGPIIGDLIEDGHVSRPWHGLYGQMTIRPILGILGFPPEEWPDATGFLIETIEPGSAAERAGLRGGSWPIMWGGMQILLGGDIITHVNGVRIDRLATALDVVRGLEVGQEVTLAYIRGGVAQETTVSMEERPMMAQELEIYRHRETR